MCRSAFEHGLQTFSTHFRAHPESASQVGSILRWLQQEQQLLVIVTRTPLSSHASGFEFPTVQVAPIWASLTTHRLRLRKEREGGVNGPGFQVLVETELMTSKGPGCHAVAPVRYNVWLNQAGVRVRLVASSA